MCSQYARPDIDIYVQGWTGYPTAGIYDKINEVIPSGATRIYESTTQPFTCRIGLSAVLDPNIHTGHIFKHMACNQGGIPPFYLVSIYQGTTLIAEWDRAADLTDSYPNWMTFEETLTEEEASKITDYTALELRIKAQNGVTFVLVCWVVLQVPDVVIISTHHMMMGVE